VFLGAVSGGLIALGLVATAAKTGAAFYVFGLILLPTLAFVGLATFHRVLQSGLADLEYARRIARLRDYYLDHAPELTSYLVNPAESLPAPGLGIRLWQQFVTAAGMVAVITAVLAGSAAGLLAAAVSGHLLVAAVAAGVVVAAATLTGLMRYQNSAWIRGTQTSLSPAQNQGHTVTPGSRLMWGLRHSSVAQSRSTVTARRLRVRFAQSHQGCRTAGRSRAWPERAVVGGSGWRRARATQECDRLGACWSRQDDAAVREPATRTPNDACPPTELSRPGTGLCGGRQVRARRCPMPCSVS
jgi:hypothetical protein